MAQTKLEREYQPGLIKRIQTLFPDCLIQKNDPNYRQGVPDLLVLNFDRWALLEVKKSENEKPRPNQPYWVDWAKARSFGAFIYPENEDEVLNALLHFFNQR